MANPSFMQGIDAANAGLSIRDNPYRWGLRVSCMTSAQLWDLGFTFQMERICAS